LWFSMIFRLLSFLERYYTASIVREVAATGRMV